VNAPKNAPVISPREDPSEGLTPDPKGVIAPLENKGTGRITPPVEGLKPAGKGRN
jgi:hypothetical protein